jgi:hypothetical protein
VKSWLAYSGSFACALGAAALCYFAGFYTIMTGASDGIPAFFLFVIIVPVAAGLVTFGVTYLAFTKHSFGLAGWAQGIAFVALASAVYVGLIVGNVVEGLVATILLVLLLFAGGRWMTQRAAHA